MNLSLPSSLFESFNSLVQIDQEKLLEAHQLPPVVSVRMNPFKRVSSFENEEKVPWSSNGYYLKDRPNFTADPILHAGAYYVQEASSMFLEHALQQLLDFNQTLLALDLCAAPGGKTTLLSSLINDQSLLIANEVISNRASILTENVTKWGRMNTWVTNNDPKHFSSLGNMFDLILVDAPCSGSGLFRKMPEFVNDWNLDQVHLCSQRQERILHDIYPCLKEGGIMVYMTCSFCVEENEAMVDKILNEFDVESCKIDIDPSWGIVETISEDRQGYGYRFFPHLLKGEGFFLSCFKRKGILGSSNYFSSTKNTKNDLAPLRQYISTEGKAGLLQNDLLIVLEESHLDWLHELGKSLRIIKKGILCGKVIRNELIPEHELAMYIGLKDEVPAVELTYTDAIMYLQKEHIVIDDSRKGWLLVRYHLQNLGWIKNLGNRINNYYPSNYRILNKNILSA